jgi:hypothetical protein
VRISRLELRPAIGTLGLSVAAHETTSLTEANYSDSLEDAVAFFRRGSLGYSASEVTGHRCHGSTSRKPEVGRSSSDRRAHGLDHVRQHKCVSERFVHVRFWNRNAQPHCPMAKSRNTAYSFGEECRDTDLPLSRSPDRSISGCASSLQDERHHGELLTTPTSLPRRSRASTFQGSSLSLPMIQAP